MKHEALISRELAYEGSFINVNRDEVQLPNGHVTTLELIEHPGAAAIVPLDKDGNIVLIRQYRYAAGGFILEIPAGKRSPDEDPVLCARRELEEETGLIAEHITPLGFIFTTPGFTDEKIWIYLAEGLTETEQALEDGEVLTVKRLAAEEAFKLAENGEINDGKSICGLLRARAHLKTRKSKTTR